MNGKIKNQLTTEQISARAYEIWLKEGCPAGRDMANWTQAEQELQATSSPGAGTPRPSPLSRGSQRNNTKQRETVAA